MPPTNAWEPEAALCSNGLGAALRSCRGKSFGQGHGRRAILYLVSLVAYSFLGAAVFSALERLPALERQRSAEALIVQFLDKFQCVDSNSLSGLLMNLSELVSDMNRLSPNATMSATSNWDFDSALYFSVTVFTTVGYGNLAPVTFLGRAFCCLYALIGIPLLAMLLTAMANQLKQLSRWCIGLGCWRDRTQLAKFVICCVYVATGTLLYFVIPSLVFAELEDWEFGTGVYYCFITLTTVGFGDFIPAQMFHSIPYKLLLSVWMLTGLVYVSGLVSGVQLLMQRGAESITSISKEDAEALEAPIDQGKEESTENAGTPPSGPQVAKEGDGPPDSESTVECFDCGEMHWDAADSQATANTDCCRVERVQGP